MTRRDPPNDPAPWPSDIVPVWRSAGPRVGIVGAGRTRQGLGPYLASAFEATGARIVAVAGRNEAGARAAAAALAAQLQHPVGWAPSAMDLARAVDVLVIASPVASHLEGLDAALAAGVACLCEKPLVGWQDAAAGRSRVAAFAARGLLLDENCQWPFVLPALFDLHRDLVGAPVRSVAMGLSPVGVGRAMAEDSLSHVLSVVQALRPLDASTSVAGLREADPAAAAERNVISFDLVAPGGPLAVELHLERCPEPPRPAWIAVNGRRMDRRVGPGYAQSFVAGDGREVKVPDPLRQLVYRLATTLQAKPRERTAALAASLDVRLRLYADLLRRLADAGS